MTLKALDADGNIVFLDSDGLGTELSPLVVKHQVSNFPVPLTEIAVNNFPVPATQIAVSNLPVTQPISGTVAVSNLPAPLTEIAVSNFPAPITQLAITNFPQTQPVSGAFFPATQAISATALPLPDNASTEPTLTAVRDRLVELAGYVDGLETAIATLLTRTPPLGATTAANATPVTLSLDGAFATNFGAVDSPVATSDTGAFSLLSFVKRLFSKLPSALSNDRLKVENSALSTARTTSFISTTTAGTVVAGANSVVIANAGGAVGTVKGVSLPAGASVSWSANGNDTLDSINYSAVSTIFLITSVT